MNTEKYLRRIGIGNSELSPTAENLKLLQQQHLLTVPFENLDIHWKRPILLDAARFYEKIVEDRRGGFCYELNGLFNELLRTLGFQTRLVSARVAQRAGGFGEEYDHLAIVVTIDDQEYLADVGFGAFSAEPLLIDSGVEQRDANGTFAIRKYDEDYLEVVKKDGDIWQSEYIFKPVERALAEFAGMCEFHQTSPESHFTRGMLCSMMTADGRKTLTRKSFITTVSGIKNEKEIGSEDKFYEVLLREFGIARHAY